MNSSMTSMMDADILKLEDKYLTFWTDKQLYGIPIANVEQIVQYQEITCMPESKDYVMGIINLRGAIIPVVDIRVRFRKTPQEYNERTCIIVTNIRNIKIGIIVDGVNEVTDIEKENISEPPSVSRMDNNDYLTGIGKTKKQVTLILDLDKLMMDEDLNLLSEQFGREP